jgi:hypothetical protein
MISYVLPMWSSQYKFTKIMIASGIGSTNENLRSDCCTIDSNQLSQRGRREDDLRAEIGSKGPIRGSRHEQTPQVTIQAQQYPDCNVTADHCYGMSPYDEEAPLLSGLKHLSEPSIPLEILAKTYENIKSASSSNDLFDAKIRLISSTSIALRRGVESED